MSCTATRETPSGRSKVLSYPPLNIRVPCLRHILGARRTRARTMDVDEVIDELFSGRGSTGELPQSVPLPQMIDLLVDLWEAEGLFD